MIKKILYLKRIIAMMAIIQIIFLFWKNIGLVSRNFMPYEVVEAKIVDIKPTYNNVLNFKTKVLFFYNGKQESMELYHTLGDKYGKLINIMVFDNGKITRLKLTLSHGDIICILFYLLLYFQVSKQYRNKRQQAAIIYARKLHERQTEEDNSVKEDNFEGEGNSDEENIRKKLITKKEVMYCIIVTLCIGFTSKFGLEFLIWLVLLLILFSAIILLKLKDNCKEKLKRISEEKEQKRKKSILCVITNVKTNLDIDYTESFQIFCKYIDLNGKVYQFKSPKIIGRCNYKEGENISVLVEPDNYCNYWVLVKSFEIN